MTLFFTKSHSNIILSFENVFWCYFIIIFLLSYYQPKLKCIKVPLCYMLQTHTHTTYLCNIKNYDEQFSTLTSARWQRFVNVVKVDDELLPWTRDKDSQTPQSTLVNT